MYRILWMQKMLLLFFKEKHVRGVVCSNYVGLSAHVC